MPRTAKAGSPAFNLDIIIPAVAALSTALGIGFVTNATKAAFAARGLGGALMGAFGGPVGIAITGVTLAVAGFATEAASARAAIDGVEGITAEAARTLNDAKGKADSAASGVKGVGSEAATSETKVRSFAGAVGEAAQQLYELAKARQAALIADLEAKRQQASVQYSDMYRQSRKGLDERVAGDGSLRHQIFSLDGWKADLTRLGRSLGVVDDPEAQLQEGMGKLRDTMADYDAAIRDASRNLERFAVKPSQTPALGNGKGSGTSRATGGKSDTQRAADAEKQLQERIASTTADLRLQLHLADLRTQRLDVQADKEQALASLHQQFPELVGSGNAKLKEQLALMEGLTVAAIDRAEAQSKTQEEKDRQSSYAAIIGDGQAFVRDQTIDRQAMGMEPQAASAYRHEQEMLNQAQQAGISLTASQRSEIAQLAQGMAAAEQATTAFAQSQQKAADLSQFFGESAVDALHGVITGTKSASQSLADMGSAITKMALQALLLNTGPLAGLFTGGKGVSGGSGSSVLSSLLGGGGSSGGGLSSLFGSGGGAGASGAASAGASGQLGGLMGGAGAASTLMPMIAGSLAMGAIGKKIGGTGGKIVSLLGGGLLGGLTGGVFGFADGGHIRGKGTGRSDSIPIMASNGEYMVNAAATKRNLPLLEAINSGRAPKFANGGRIGGSLSNTYSPSVSISMSGNQDGRVARQIASAVGDALDARKPDSFRRSSTQQMADSARQMQRAGGRNN